MTCSYTFDFDIDQSKLLPLKDIDYKYVVTFFLLRFTLILRNDI